MNVVLESYRLGLSHRLEDCFMAILINLSSPNIAYYTTELNEYHAFEVNDAFQDMLKEWRISADGRG